ncbi:TetR/AcrR family transcriptional regulator [Blastococcus sp. SYSU DS0616]
MPIPGGRRRGRPPEAERAQRRDQALDAALEEILRAGYERMTMSAVAARAGSSKESLYSWFASKEGMVTALIRRQSAATNALVEQAVNRGGAPSDVLLGIARGLLDLLTSETSLALNRAAMTSSPLAVVLLRHGRHTTGPLVEGYLSRLADDGVLVIEDPGSAFALFYGLVIQDVQIRALLGEAPPSGPDRQRRAQLAVDAFLRLTQPPRRPRSD